MKFPWYFSKMFMQYFYYCNITIGPLGVTYKKKKSILDHLKVDFSNLFIIKKSILRYLNFFFVIFK